MSSPDLSLPAASPFLRAGALTLAEVTGTGVTGTLATGPDQHTPWGVVHGGVYTTAVESACSAGASAAVAGNGQYAVGVSNQTDFLRPLREGELELAAWPIHQGRTQQLWQCEIKRPDGKLIARGQLRLQNVENDATDRTPG
ncbi:MAG: PaaI family thioesterase [Solirubrobacterales bacterium]|nr:PaaI family thioesterase [Solirubrobacterales bacterium]